MVSWEALIAFAIVFAAFCAAPGPAVASVVARVVAQGSTGMVWFVGGLMLGDILWFLIAVFGLAALAALVQPVFFVLKYLGAAYLLYLAWKLWAAPVAVNATEPVRGQGPKLFGGGLLITMSNPKTMLFYLAMLPALIDLPSLSAMGMLEIAVTIATVFAVVFFGLVVLAAQVRRLFTSPRAIQIVNRTSGVAMAGAAGAIALRE